MDNLLKYIMTQLWDYSLCLHNYNIQDAKDLLQDTCLKVVVNWDKYFKTMDEIHRKKVAKIIMKYAFIDSKRKLRKKVEFKDYMIPDLTNDRIEYLKDLEHDINVVYNHVFSSKDICSHALALKLSGMKAREIAIVQNVNINTALGRIRYAKRNVRKHNFNLRLFHLK